MQKHLRSALGLAVLGACMMGPVVHADDEITMLKGVSQPQTMTSSAIETVQGQGCYQLYGRGLVCPPPYTPIPRVNQGTRFQNQFSAHNLTLLQRMFRDHAYWTQNQWAAGMGI